MPWPPHAPAAPVLHGAAPGVSPHRVVTSPKPNGYSSAMRGDGARTADARVSPSRRTACFRFRGAAATPSTTWFRPAAAVMQVSATQRSRAGCVDDGSTNRRSSSPGLSFCASFASGTSRATLTPPLPEPIQHPLNPARQPPRPVELGAEHREPEEDDQPSRPRQWNEHETAESHDRPDESDGDTVGDLDTRMPRDPRARCAQHPSDRAVLALGVSDLGTDLTLE